MKKHPKFPLEITYFVVLHVKVPSNHKMIIKIATCKKILWINSEFNYEEVKTRNMHKIELNTGNALKTLNASNSQAK